MQHDIDDQLLADIEENFPENLPDELKKRVTRFVELDELIAEKEQELEELKREYNHLKTTGIPDAMSELGLDMVGLPDAGVDIKLTPFCRASISVKWPEERRQRAFQHLKELGGGDLIKTKLSVNAAKGHEESMQRIAERVTQMLAEYGVEASIEMVPTVQWNSLSSFVKECVEHGEPVDLEALGATYGEVAKVVRKGS